MQSVSALTEGLIDYAGLFPPAGLEMAQAVRNYAEYRSGSDSSMLGRFILSASRLPEFSAAMTGLPRGSGTSRWKLAVLLGGDFEAEIKSALNFTSDHAVIDTAEIKVSDSTQPARISAALPGSWRGFLEVPATNLDEEVVDAIRNAKLAAKIRTGGIEESAFPSASAVIRFLTACEERGLAFKATAGLHHIVCGSYALTYEPNANSGEMFGFLNVFLAAAFLYSGSSADEAAAILSERDATSFVFSESSLTWRGRTLTTAQIKKARNEFAISFGSCSFTEPVEELARLIESNRTRNK